MLIATWILLVMLLGTMVFAVVRVGAEPRTRTVTEPDVARKVHGGSPVDSAGTQRRDTVEGRNGLASRSLNVSGSVTVGLYRGHTARYYDAKFRGMRHLAYLRHKRIKQLKRTLLARPSVAEAINLACVVYGHCPTLWRKAGCETGGTYSPRSLNSSSGARGVFQFLPSTWRTTPYGRFDVFSPYANALAAGWMHAHGRGGEWQCR